MKINNLMMISGLFVVFIAVIYLSLIVTADEIDLGDGQYQEIPPNEINGDEVEYSESDNNDHPDNTDLEEEQQRNYDDLDEGQQEGQVETYENNESSEDGTSEVQDDDNNLSSGKKGEVSAVSAEEESEIINNLIVLHEDNQKIMISLWCLFGLLLGTKLIKGMFGNG